MWRYAKIFGDYNGLLAASKLYRTPLCFGNSSTVAVFGQGPCVTCPIVPRTMPRLPAAGRKARPFGSRSLPAAVAPRFRDATPRSASERLRRRPSMSEDGADIASMRCVVNYVFICSHEVVM